MRFYLSLKDMLLINIIKEIGRYTAFIKRIFSRPPKHRVFFKQLIKEMDALGVNSIGIVLIISFFMGAVITLQLAYNIELPIIPKYTVGVGARDTMLLEFSSTVVGLILAGKVGSHIASEIGTMRVTEQIDVLDVMGIDSVGFLMLPKVVALVTLMPFLVLISMFVGVFGGWLAGSFTGVVPSEEFIYGAQYAFVPFYIVYSLIKSVIFAFLITTISGYYGYNTSGGSLEVGKSSTKAVVVSSVQILLFNLLLTQLMLT